MFIACRGEIIGNSSLVNLYVEDLIKNFEKNRKKGNDTPEKGYGFDYAGNFTVFDDEIDGPLFMINEDTIIDPMDLV